MGDVVGDLNRRRGMIEGMDENPAGKIVRALTYRSPRCSATQRTCSSATQGRATYTMEFE